MTKTPLLSLYLDTRRAKDSSSKSPLKLRIYLNKKTVFHSLNIDLTQEDFDKSYGADKPKGEYKNLKLALESKLAQAYEIASKLKPFTFEAFELRYYGKYKATSDDVISYYNLKIDQLKQEGRVGTADSYQCSLTSILQQLRTFMNAATISTQTADFILTNGQRFLGRVRQSNIETNQVQF